MDEAFQFHFEGLEGEGSPLCPGPLNPPLMNISRLPKAIASMLATFAACPPAIIDEMNVPHKDRALIRVIS